MYNALGSPSMFLSALLLNGAVAGSLHPRPNAIARSNGDILPALPIDGTDELVAFVLEGGNISALDGASAVRWSRASPPHTVQIYSGFDFDGDGWPDVGVSKIWPTGSRCGQYDLSNTSIDFLRGVSGELHSPVTPLTDICWNFTGPSCDVHCVYPTHSWTIDGLMYGGGATELVLSPTYRTTPGIADKSWAFTWTGSELNTSSFLWWPGCLTNNNNVSTGSPRCTPDSVSQFSGYAMSQPNAYATAFCDQHDRKCTINPHVPNGLIANVNGTRRLIFWTSSRVVQYALGGPGPMELLHDTPYLTNNDHALVGRNYGLIEQDPEAPHIFYLVTGSNTGSLYSDLMATNRPCDPAHSSFDSQYANCSDPWAGIERHVSVYDALQGRVQDVFFSYAHTGHNAALYEGRTVAPAATLIRVGQSKNSRIAFNVYSAVDDAWTLHITEPGGVESAYTLRNEFLWDIRDLDGDGTDELAISTCSGYYPAFSTSFYRWDESKAANRLVPIGTLHGVVPHLSASGKPTAGRSSSSNLWYPILTVAAGPGSEDSFLVMQFPNGTVALLQAPWRTAAAASK